MATPNTAALTADLDKISELRSSALTPAEIRAGIEKAKELTALTSSTAEIEQAIVDSANVTNKVDNSRVLTDVPDGAVFTDNDTIYDDSALVNSVAAKSNTTDVNNALATKAELQGTSTVFGGAKFALSGTTLTITTV